MKTPYALVALAAVVAHATALAGGFIWLDHAHLEDGLALAQTQGWAALFTHGFAGTGFYRPLMAISLSLDATAGGTPWVYHATTLAFHAAAAVATSVAAATLGLSRRAALLAGLLFAVHPATSLVAGAVAFRSEAMIAVALLALVVLHVRARPAGAALALLAGALTKETALVLGPLLVIALELDRRRVIRAPARARARLLAAEGAAFAVAVTLRVAFAPAWRATFVPLSPGDAIGTRLASLWRSAILGVLPFDRTICDATGIRSLGSPAAAAGLLVAAGLAYLTWKRRGPALLLAVAMLPSLNLVPVMRWWSPHYLYVPLAFAVMLVAEAIADLGPHMRTAAGVILAGMALVSARDGLRFRTDATLWGPEVAANTACREGHFYLAETALAERRWDEAADHYERAAAPTTGSTSRACGWS
jgi:hypothetical protein